VRIVTRRVVFAVALRRERKAACRTRTKWWHGPGWVTRGRNCSARPASWICLRD